MRSVQAKPVKRCVVRVISVAGAVNGAFCSMTLSRCGTLTFQSPPSSASAQISVAGSVGRQENSRGPVGTPATGTRSVSGIDAMVVDVTALRLAMFHTCTSRGKRSCVVT